jgi:hypothetical protein
MNHYHYDFARRLVKGKIAETVFAQMLREAEAYTVLDFGYERVLPELLQQGLQHDDTVFDTLRTAPDFAVIDKTQKKVFLIEVKYQHELNKYKVLDAANRMHTAWNPSYLFVATLDGFFFDDIATIIAHGGDISPLKDPYIPPAVQAKYLQILRDFEGDAANTVRQ